MTFHFQNFKSNKLNRGLGFLAAFFLVLESILSPVASYAQSVYDLPAVGAQVNLSQSFAPAVLKGIRIDPKEPLNFDFIVDAGDSGLKDAELKKESEKLIKYFLASLTVPKDELWVNLSPYEKDRIIPDSLSQTDMGRDLLAQDYILKQLTAALVYPEDELGAKFWEEVYSKVKTKYGAKDLPVNTLSKVWIIPDKATIYEKNNTAYIVDSHLKVMLEEDYVAMDKQKAMAESRDSSRDSDLQRTNGEINNILRSIIIPAIEKEVNTGKNFANLRQVVNSLILATWYKTNLKESLLGKVYVDKNKIFGIVTADENFKEKIYNRYLEALEAGARNYIREDYDPKTRQLVPRKYFVGGLNLEGIGYRSSSADNEKINRLSPGPVSEINLTLRTDRNMLSGIEKKAPALSRFNDLKIVSWQNGAMIAEGYIDDPNEKILVKLLTDDSLKNKREFAVYEELLAHDSSLSFLELFPSYEGQAVLESSDLNLPLFAGKIGLSEGTKYFVVRKAQGVNIRERIVELKEKLQGAHSLEADEHVIGDLYSIIDAIKRLHARGIILKNLRADNILIDPRKNSITIDVVSSLSIADAHNSEIDIYGGQRKTYQQGNKLLYYGKADIESFDEIALLYSEGLLSSKSSLISSLSSLRLSAAEFFYKTSDPYELSEVVPSIGADEILLLLANKRNNIGVWNQSRKIRELGAEKGGEAVLELRKLLNPLKTQEPRLRSAALDGLMATNSPLSVRAIATALKDPDRFVKRSAASYLGNFPRSKVAVKALIKALADPDSAVFENALDSISKIGDEDTIVELNILRSGEPKIMTFSRFDDHGGMIRYTKKPVYTGYNAQKLTYQGEETIENPRVSQYSKTIADLQRKLKEERLKRKINLEEVKDKRIPAFFKWLEEKGLADYFVIVGGGVRDLYTGEMLNDLDIGIKVELTDEERLQFITPINQATERVWQYSMDKLKLLADALGEDVNVFLPPLFGKKSVFWSDGKNPTIEIQYTGPIRQVDSEDGTPIYIKRSLFDENDRSVYLTRTNAALLSTGIDSRGNIYGRVSAFDDFDNGIAQLAGDGDNFDIGAIMRFLRLKYQFGLKITQDDYSLVQEQIKRYLSDDSEIPSVIIYFVLSRQIERLLATAKDKDAAHLELERLGIYKLLDLGKHRQIKPEEIEAWGLNIAPALEAAIMEISDIRKSRQREILKSSLLNILNVQSKPITKRRLFEILRINPDFAKVNFREVLQTIAYYSILANHIYLLRKPSLSDLAEERANAVPGSGVTNSRLRFSMDDVTNVIINPEVLEYDFGISFDELTDEEILLLAKTPYPAIGQTLGLTIAENTKLNLKQLLELLEIRDNSLTEIVLENIVSRFKGATNLKDTLQSRMLLIRNELRAARLLRYEWLKTNTDIVDKYSLSFVANNEYAGLRNKAKKFKDEIILYAKAIAKLDGKDTVVHGSAMNVVFNPLGNFLPHSSARLNRNIGMIKIEQLLDKESEMAPVWSRLDSDELYLSEREVTGGDSGINQVRVKKYIRYRERKTGKLYYSTQYEKAQMFSVISSYLFFRLIGLPIRPTFVLRKEDGEPILLREIIHNSSPLDEYKIVFGEDAIQFASVWRRLLKGALLADNVLGHRGRGQDTISIITNADGSKKPFFDEMRSAFGIPDVIDDKIPISEQVNYNFSDNVVSLPDRQVTAGVSGLFPDELSANPYQSKARHADLAWMAGYLKQVTPEQLRGILDYANKAVPNNGLDVEAIFMEWQKALDKVREIYPDKAQLSNRNSQETPGGIDLNPDNITMDIKSDGLKPRFEFSPDILEAYPIRGFEPVIINISPINSLPLYLGIIKAEGEMSISRLN
ncbi:MAG: HEAT repeat domain-containing protein [Candidatus Omnitrophica bacterium]|nr:HEAT repeat domain-containing protein [Candidatus Omnitrophota bacterium]